MEEEPPPPAGGEGNALVASDALWIAAASNGVGVEGSWYEFHDAVSTNIEIGAVDGVVCLTGTVAAKADAEDYDTFGAGMGLNFADEDEWDGSAYSGVTFTAEFTSDNPIEVRVPITGLQDTGKEHFVPLKSGSNSISWSDLEQPSWVEAADAEAFDATKIIALQFAVTATVDGENTFEVCISNLTVDE
jgi:hypothetical protein